MLIKDVIRKIKRYHRAFDKIDPIKTRDQMLYGADDRECTGIVTSIWASTQVIKKAHELGANLIVCHEALFWNHGDHQEWLQETGNTVYSDKKALLDEYGITVWRDHDHIHSGIPYNGEWIDGIFWGFAKQLGWLEYATMNKNANGVISPTEFILPETTVGEVAKTMIEKMGINGVKVVGDPDTKISKVWVCGHNFGDAENMITYAEQNNVDLVMPLELIDFTLLEYVRDANALGHGKAIVTAGHFNTEEPGMKFMIDWLPEALGEEIPATYVQAGDTYNFIVK